MRQERYSIEVSDDFVEIHGDLTVEEAFDYINFFDKKGYKSLRSGWENSTLLLSRKDVFQQQEEVRKKEAAEEERMYHDFFESEKKEHQITKTRLKQIEELIKTLFNEESEKIKTLRAQNYALSKHLMNTNLSQNPEFQKIINSFTIVPPIPDSTDCVDMGCAAKGTPIRPENYIDPCAIHRDPLEIPDPEEKS